MNDHLATPNVSLAGLDGCRGGWVMVRRDGIGAFDEPCILNQIDAMPQTDIVVIDMLIGLPETGSRACDLEARALLGRRRSSVFTGARRPLLNFRDYAVANAWAKSDGAGMSKQLWHILDKIRQVDAWITPADQKWCREGHPELAFLAAAGTPLAYSKKTPEGEAERCAALARFIPPPQLKSWLDGLSGKMAARDDLIDAAILCRSAARVALGMARHLPANPGRDATGLVMEMVF